MSLAVSPKNVGKYTEFLSLIWKYGNRHFLKTIGLQKLPGFNGKDEDASPGPEDLAEDLEKLGPTYIKIGQLLSAQLNILPPKYMEAMSRLQDNVEPLQFDEIVPVIEEGLGTPYRSVFREFDTVAIGSASLGQVYRAQLMDGTPVAVKVQRPGALDRISEDFEAIGHIASGIDSMTNNQYGLSDIATHTENQLRAELDYTLECNNLARMRKLMSDVDRVNVPKPISHLTSERVLVMSYLPGERLTSLSPKRIEEVDGDELATKLFKKYLDHILVEGFFHADPHPGNVLVDEHNDLVLLDLGMVGRVPPRMRAMLTQLVLAITDGRGEDVAEAAIQIGDPKGGYDRDAFTRAISELVLLQYNNTIEAMNIGDVVLQIAKLCGEHRVKVPPLLSTVGKALVNLDQLGQVLSPGFNPSQAIRDHTAPILWQDFWQAISPTTFFGEVFEIKRLAQNLPFRLNTIIDTLAREDRGIKIDAIDERELLNGAEKIANRITYGLMIAALFIAGAMIMNIDQAGWRLGGVPVISIVMFVAGTIGIGITLAGMYFVRGPKSERLKKKD
jgi:predicted unusual protein kinase regulating ubiquinone biosynthesis (AarF/ABC1/UbiB family)